MRKNNRRSGLLSVIILIYAGVMFLITGISMAKPQHNLIPIRIIIYTFAVIVVLIAMRCLWLFGENRLQKRAERFNRIGFGIVLSLFAVVLWVSGYIARSDVYTDYGNVWSAASALANGLSPDNWSYFSTCPNNRFDMLILAGMLKAGMMLGLSDGYEFALTLQVIHWSVVLWCIYYLAGKSGKNLIADRWTAVSLFLLMTPLYGNIAFFYTDQCSFGYGILAFTLFYISTLDEIGKKKAIILDLAAGLLWGIGFQIKVTVVISLLAVLIVVCLKANDLYYLRRSCYALLGCAAAVGIISLSMKTLPCEKDIYTDSNPVLYWVALGLNGNGSYADNEEFAIQCYVAENIDVRREIVVDKLKSDWHNFFDLDHLVQKTRMNFACGDLGVFGYMEQPFKEGNVIWKLMSYNGPYFWKYACVSTSYIFAVYLLVALGAARFFHTKESNIILGVSYITLFGVVVFLMLWEAQNKLLFNHIGWLVLAAAYGLNWIGGKSWTKSRRCAPWDTSRSGEHGSII